MKYVEDVAMSDPFEPAPREPGYRAAEVWMTSAAAIELAQLAEDMRLAAAAHLGRGEAEHAENWLKAASRLTALVVKARTR